MSEKTRLAPQLADTTYAHTLVIKSTHEYNVHGPFMSTFNDQTMSIGCVSKLVGSVWFSPTLPLKQKEGLAFNVENN